MQPTHARWEAVDTQAHPTVDVTSTAREISKLSMNLPKLDPVYARNFRIHDLCLESAPDSALGPPGIGYDQGSLTNIPQHVLDELPAECLQAFQQAKNREIDWKSQWRTESIDGMRAHFLPAAAWFP